MRIRDPDPGWEKSDPGSGIRKNIPDPIRNTAVGIL
jgi:hypothetical protein